MNIELIDAVKQIEKEKNIPGNVLLEEIENALASVYKKNINVNEVKVIINRKTGQQKTYIQKKVVEVVTDEKNEILLNDAVLINKDANIGDDIDIETDLRSFGRIAAQTAKQIIIQKIKDAEKNIVFDEYQKKVGKITSGTVQRFEQKNIIVDLIKTEAIIPAEEQVPTEKYRPHEKMKFYLVEIAKTPKGQQIILSRTHPNLLIKLFELEVPEIHQGIIEITGAVRDAGYRSKISVRSKDPKVDPVGACVGAKGSRVQNIVEELKGEKIDIINYSDDPVKYISNSLSPAKIKSVHLFNEYNYAFIIVPDEQLSLAIGKEGINAKLASKITGWRIDIKSETQAKDIEIKPPDDVVNEFKIKAQAKAALQTKIKAEPVVKEKESASEQKNSEVDDKKPADEPVVNIDEKFEIPIDIAETEEPEPEKVTLETELKFDFIPTAISETKEKDVNDFIITKKDSEQKNKKKKISRKRAEIEEFGEDEIDYY